jgi:hypothetical protein
MGEEYKRLDLPSLYGGDEEMLLLDSLLIDSLSIDSWRLDSLLADYLLIDLPFPRKVMKRCFSERNMMADGTNEAVRLTWEGRRWWW